MVPILTTPRLILRPIEIADAEQVQQIFPHWEIVRYLAPVVPWPYPPDGALTYFRDVALPGIERGEEWHWSLRLNSQPDKLIGCIGLRTRESNNRGFWIGLPWQGQGLMTEAVEAATDFWFNHLGFPVLRAQKAIDNHASCRISEKFGMRVIAIEERDFVSGRHLSQLCEITAEEWRNRKQQR